MSSPRDTSDAESKSTTAVEHRINLLRAQFVHRTTSEQEDTGSDLHLAVKKSLKEKTDLLARVEKVVRNTGGVLGEDNVQAYVRMNGKFPLKLRREDVFDIVLAMVKMDEQVSQSRLWIDTLEMRLRELKEEVGTEARLKRELLYLKENVDRVLEDNDDNEVPGIKTLIKAERTKYKRLREIVHDLIDRYEDEEEMEEDDIDDFVVNYDSD